MSGDDHFIKPDNNATGCQSCGGSGEIFHGGGGPDDPERCHICNGTGEADEIGRLKSRIQLLEAGEVLWRETDRAVREELKRHMTNARHWREECGKLHAQLAKAKADLQSWEITAKRIEEAEARKSFDDGTCIRCGAAPRNASCLCATCLDEDAVRAGELDDGPSRISDRYVSVPFDPTPAMTEAAHKASLAGDEPMSPDFPDLNSKIWRAMILAGVAEQSGAGAPETSVRCGAPAALSHLHEDRKSGVVRRGD